MGTAPRDGLSVISICMAGALLAGGGTSARGQEADETVQMIRTAVAVGTAGGRHERLFVSVGGPSEHVTVVSASEEELVVRTDTVQTPVPWRRIAPRSIYEIGSRYLRDDDPFSRLCLAAYCAANDLTEQARSEWYRAVLLDPELAEVARNVIENLEREGPPRAARAATGSAPAAESRQRRATIDAVRRLLRSDLAAVSASLGPRDKDVRGEEAALPLIHLRHEDGTYRYKIDRVKDPVDYTGHAGQVLYVPDRPRDHGVDRMRFCMSWHQNHGGKHLWHVYALGPTMKDWFCKSPDPGVLRSEWTQAAGGRLARPVAVGRGHVLWPNCGIMVFGSGVVGASGYGNNDDRYPFTRLRPGLVPTAVCVTPNNEFALVTAVEPRTLKSHLAVIALEARALRHHTFPYAGLPNVATFTRLKVLGYVELPRIAAPTRVAASVNVSRWRWTTPVASEALDSQAVRDKWREGVDEDHRAATAGYALVAGRFENRVAFVDLGPMLRYFHAMYFTDADHFEKTRDEGSAPGQWPHTFTHAPASTPRVVAVQPVPKPSAVAAGVSCGSNRDFGRRAYVATEDGRLIVYDVSVLVGRHSSRAGPVPVGSIAVGANPTSIAYGRSAASKDLLILTCRGDRSVVFVEPSGKGGEVVKRLRDERLKDPVCVWPWDSRGAFGISVADFAGRQVVNYLYRPISAWGDEVFGGLGRRGDAEFECTGVLKFEGYPYQVSFAEIN